jgi:hypothetical protein
MVRNIPLALALTLLLLLFASLPCQAGDAEDLQRILAGIKPGKPFVKTTFLTVSRTAGKDVLYEGRLGDIDILAWVCDGIADSLFLTVKGRQCPAWGPVVADAFAPPTLRTGNYRGQMLRYTAADCEYYLVLVNKYEDKNFLTDLTVFRRGASHEINERYHEFADIWTEILSSPAEEFKWPDPSVKDSAG